MDYVSIRMNTKENWKYGYFEMKAKVPANEVRGAAFWMMPQNFYRIGRWTERSISWNMWDTGQMSPSCPYIPKVTITWRIRKKRRLKTLPMPKRNFTCTDWSGRKTKITGYVDGIPYFTFANDKLGDEKHLAFRCSFYLKLNLAIGGNWGD